MDSKFGNFSELLIFLETNSDITIGREYINKILRDHYGSGIDFKNFYEPVMNRCDWVHVLHHSPQDFIHHLRIIFKEKNSFMSLSQEIENHEFGKLISRDYLSQIFNTRLFDTDAVTSAARLIIPAIFFIVLGYNQSENESDNNSSAAEYSLLFNLLKVTTNDAITLELRLTKIDLFRFVVDPQKLSIYMRTKFVEAIIVGIKQIQDSLPVAPSMTDAGKIKDSERRWLPGGTLKRKSGEKRLTTESDVSVQEMLQLITSYVHALHAVLPAHPIGVDGDLSSDENTWAANVGVKTLPVIALLLENSAITAFLKAHRFTQDAVVFRYAISSFVTRLSENYDNRVMITQTANGVVTRVLLRWLEDLQERSDGTNSRMSGSFFSDSPGRQKSTAAVTENSEEHRLLKWATGPAFLVRESVLGLVRLSAETEGHLTWRGRVHCALILKNVSSTPSNVYSLISDWEVFGRIIRLAVSPMENSVYSGSFEESEKRDEILRCVLTSLQNVSSSKLFVTALVEFYAELAAYSPKSALHDWSRSISRGSSRFKMFGGSMRVPSFARVPVVQQNSISIKDFMESLLKHIGPTRTAHVELQVMSTLADIAYSEAMKEGRASESANTTPSIASIFEQLLNSGSCKEFCRRIGIFECVGYLHQPVQFEVARLTWSLLRHPKLFGMSAEAVAVDEHFLQDIVLNLDVYGASVGVADENDPRRVLRNEEIADLLEQLSQLPNENPEARHDFNSRASMRSTLAVIEAQSDSGGSPERPAVTPSVQLFAAWTLAHFCLNLEDQASIVALRGVIILGRSVSKIGGRINAERRKLMDLSVADTKLLQIQYVTLKLLMFALSRLTTQRDRGVHFGYSAEDFLKNLSNTYSSIEAIEGIENFFPDSRGWKASSPNVKEGSAAVMDRPSRYYVVSDGGLRWLPVVDPALSVLIPPFQLMHVNVDLSQLKDEQQFTVLSDDKLEETRVNLSPQERASLQSPVTDADVGHGLKQMQLSSLYRIETSANRVLREGLDPDQIDAKICLATILENSLRHQAVVTQLKSSGALTVVVELSLDNFLSHSLFLRTLMKLPALDLLSNPSVGSLESWLWSTLRSLPKAVDHSGALQAITNLISPRIPRRRAFGSREGSRDQSDSAGSRDLEDKNSGSSAELRAEPDRSSRGTIDLEDLDAKGLILKLLASLISVSAAGNTSISPSTAPSNSKQTNLSAERVVTNSSDDTYKSDKQKEYEKKLFLKRVLTQSLSTDFGDRESLVQQYSANALFVQSYLSRFCNPIFLEDQLLKLFDIVDDQLGYEINQENLTACVSLLGWQINLIEVYGTLCYTYQKLADLSFGHSGAEGMFLLNDGHMEGLARVLETCNVKLIVPTLSRSSMSPQQIGEVLKLMERRADMTYRCLGAASDLMQQAIVGEELFSDCRNTDDDDESVKATSGWREEGGVRIIPSIHPVLRAFFSHDGIFDVCCHLLESDPEHYSPHLFPLIVRLVRHSEYLYASRKKGNIAVYENFYYCLNRLMKTSLDAVGVLLPKYRDLYRQEQVRASGSDEGSTAAAAVEDDPLINLLKMLLIITESVKLKLQPPTTQQTTTLVSCLSYPLRTDTLSCFIRQLTEEHKQMKSGSSVSPSKSTSPQISPSSTGHAVNSAPFFDFDESLESSVSGRPKAVSALPTLKISKSKGVAPLGSSSIDTGEGVDSSRRSSSSQSRSSRLGMGLLDTYNTTRAAIVRNAAAKLTLKLLNESGVSRTILFPNASLESMARKGALPNGTPRSPSFIDTGATDAGAQSLTAASEGKNANGKLNRPKRKVPMLKVEVPSGNEESSDAVPEKGIAEVEIEDTAVVEEEASIDVTLRSWMGCLPLLWAMIRFGENRGKRASIKVLNRLSQSNTLLKEAIYCMDDIKSLLRVGYIEGDVELQVELSRLLMELSRYPKLRTQLRRDGGLLLILHMNRSKVPDVKGNAELALRNFGSNHMEIFMQLLSSSASYVAKIINRDETLRKRSVGMSLLQPIHNRQLRVSIRGLVECSRNEVFVEQMCTSSFGLASVSSSRSFSVDDDSVKEPTGKKTLIDLMLLSFYVRDGEVQRDLLRLLRGLLRNGGDVFRRCMSNEQRVMVAENILYLLHPLEKEKRAASIIVTASRRVKSLSQGQLLTTLQKHASRSLRAGYDTSQVRSFEEEEDTFHHEKSASCRVALAADLDMLSTLRIAVEIIEIWSHQDTGIVEFFYEHGVVRLMVILLEGSTLWDLAAKARIRLHQDAEKAHVASEAMEPLGESEDSSAVGRLTEVVIQLQSLIIRTSLYIITSVGGLESDHDVAMGSFCRLLRFYDAFHFDKRIRKDARHTLLVLNEPVPPLNCSNWQENDVMLWGCCVGVAELMTALHKQISHALPTSSAKRRSAVAKAGGTWKWFQAITTLLGSDANRAEDDFSYMRGISFGNIADAVQKEAMNSIFSLSPDLTKRLFSSLRELQLLDTAYRKGLQTDLDASSAVAYKRVLPMTAFSTDLTRIPSFGDLQDPAGQSILVWKEVPVRSLFSLTLREHNQLILLATEITAMLGFSAVTEDCWSQWWGMYYMNGWCFETIDAGRQTVTIRLVEVGTVVPDFKFGKSKSLSQLERYSDCKNLLEHKGLEIQAYYGSMVHSLLIEKFVEVLRACNAEQDFILDSKCPLPNIRFWRVEALSIAHSRRLVHLELSSSKVSREQADPPNHVCSVLKVIEDPFGRSHIFVLDIVDMSNERDRDGRTPLIRAVIKNNRELCEKLLTDPNVDLRVVDNKRCTALLYAVILKLDHLFELLLHHITSKLQALAFHTQGDGSHSKHERFLSYRRIIDFRDHNGRAALHHAVNDVEERLRITTLLLQSKADVNIKDGDGNTPLHYACLYGHVDVVNTLIKYNANTMAKNSVKQTPLHIAADKVHHRIVYLLLQENPEMAVRAEDIKGATPLHYAMKRRTSTTQSPGGSADSARQEAEEEVVQTLLRHGADLYDLDKDGRAPVDFKLYYHEHYDEVRKAVWTYLEYQSAIRRNYWMFIMNILSFRFFVSWSSLAEKKEDERRFRRLQDAARGVRRLFGQPRVQEAVRDHWRKGGCARNALFNWISFVLYVVLFTIWGVFSSGQNRAHDFYMTNSVDQALFQQPIRNDEQPNPQYRDIQSTEDIWLWVDLFANTLASGSSTKWYEGSGRASLGDGVYLNDFDRLIGKIRFSQWRTNSEYCRVPKDANRLTSLCFPSYCPVRTWDARTWDTCVANQQQDAFGPDLKYSFQENRHKMLILGNIGTYGRGSYSVELPFSNTSTAEGFLTELKKDVAQLRADEWIDSATRVVAVEFSFFSAAINRFQYVVALIELPSFGNYPMPSYQIYPMRGFSIFEASLEYNVPDRVYGATTVILLAAVALYVIKKFRDWRAYTPYFHLNYYNYLDVLLIVMQLLAVGMQYAFVVLINHKARAYFHSERQTNDHFIDFRIEAELYLYQRLVTSLGLVVAWVKLLEPTQLMMEEFYVLVKMVLLITGKLVNSYAPLFCIIYAAWIFSSYVLLSPTNEPGYISLSAVIGYTYPQILGNMLTTYPDNAFLPGWQLLGLIVFTLVLFVVMLNLFISIINDLYNKLREQARIDWCKQQAIQITVFDRCSLAAYSSRDEPQSLQSHPHRGWRGVFGSGGTDGGDDEGHHKESEGLGRWLRRLLGETPEEVKADVDSSTRTGAVTVILPGAAIVQQTGVRRPSLPTRRFSNSAPAPPSSTPTSPNQGDSGASGEGKLNFTSMQKLKRIQDKAAATGWSYFGQSSSLAENVSPFLQQIKDWVARMESFSGAGSCPKPPQTAIDLLYQQIILVSPGQGTLAPSPELRELLQLEALHTVVLGIELISEFFPSLGKDASPPVAEDEWMAAMRALLRCANQMTLASVTATSPRGVSYSSDQTDGYKSPSKVQRRESASSPSGGDSRLEEDPQRSSTGLYLEYIRWIEDVLYTWKGADLVQTLQQILVTINTSSSKPANRRGSFLTMQLPSGTFGSATSSRGIRGRLQIRLSEYQLDILRVLSNVLGMEKELQTYEIQLRDRAYNRGFSRSSTGPRAISGNSGSSVLDSGTKLDPEVVSILFEFAAVEENDDLSEGLALLAAGIVKDFSIAELHDEMTKLLSGKVDGTKILRVTRICKRILAACGRNGANAFCTECFPRNSPIATGLRSSSSVGGLEPQTLLTQLARLLESVLSGSHRIRQVRQTGPAICQIILRTCEHCGLPGESVSSHRRTDSQGIGVWNDHRRPTPLVPLMGDEAAGDGRAGDRSQELACVLTEDVLRPLVSSLMSALALEIQHQITHDAGNGDYVDVSTWAGDAPSFGQSSVASGRRLGARVASEVDWSHEEGEDVASALVDILSYLLRLGGGTSAIGLGEECRNGVTQPPQTGLGRGEFHGRRDSGKRENTVLRMMQDSPYFEIYFALCTGSYGLLHRSIEKCLGPTISALDVDRDSDDESTSMAVSHNSLNSLTLPSGRKSYDGKNAQHHRRLGSADSQASSAAAGWLNFAPSGSSSNSPRHGTTFFSPLSTPKSTASYHSKTSGNNNTVLADLAPLADIEANAGNTAHPVSSLAQVPVKREVSGDGRTLRGLKKKSVSFIMDEDSDTDSKDP